MTTPRRGKWIAYLGWGVLAIAVAGFWFDTSRRPVYFDKYSHRHLVLLVELSLAAVALGFYARFLARPQFLRRSGGRMIEVRAGGKIFFTAILLIAVLAPFEWVLSSRHRDRLLERAAGSGGFDPFLQAASPRSDDQLGTNRWGFRGEDIELKKPSDVFRIFVVGGSTVYCDRVERHESHTWLLQEHLRSLRPGQQIEVQNAGMHWHTSQHSLMKYLFNIQDFDPDLVILYHGINDLTRGWSPDLYARGTYRRDYSHYNGPVARMLKTYFKAEPPPRFRSLRAISIFVSERWFSDFRNPRGPRVPIDRVRFDSYPSADAFARNLENLASVLEQQGVGLVMASQPFLYKEGMTAKEEATIWIPKMQMTNGKIPDMRTMINGMNTFNAISKAVAERAGVPYVDLEAEVPKTLEYFLDGVHYTPRGNAVIGRALADAVVHGRYIEEKFPDTERR